MGVEPEKQANLNSVVHRDCVEGPELCKGQLERKGRSPDAGVVLGPILADSLLLVELVEREMVNHDPLSHIIFHVKFDLKNFVDDPMHVVVPQGLVFRLELLPKLVVVSADHVVDVEVKAVGIV